jgi:hypothetical protein
MGERREWLFAPRRRLALCPRVTIRTNLRPGKAKWQDRREGDERQRGRETKKA